MAAISGDKDHRRALSNNHQHTAQVHAQRRIHVLLNYHLATQKNYKSDTNIDDKDGGKSFEKAASISQQNNKTTGLKDRFSRPPFKDSTP